VRKKLKQHLQEWVNQMTKIYNFKKYNWDNVRSTITDERHLRAFNSIFIEFERLYELHKANDWPDQSSYDKLDELQLHLDNYRKAYKTH